MPSCTLLGVSYIYECGYLHYVVLLGGFSQDLSNGTGRSRYPAFFIITLKSFSDSWVSVRFLCSAD